MKCGKKPKEREKYILRAQNGELIEVTREVYLEWYQSRRREKYQRERNQKYGVCSLNVLEETGMLSAVSVPDKGGLEELVFQKIQRNELMKALKKLPEQEKTYPDRALPDYAVRRDRDRSRWTLKSV